MPPPSDAGPLGVLGGTFDPIHHGHLRLAEEAIDTLGLDRVLLIPAGRPPHRAPPRAAPSDRLAMARLAAAANDRLEVDDVEVREQAPSYTVPTLERLRARWKSRPLVLLLGADAFRGLESWHRWESLFELAHIGVATRPGYELAEQSLPARLNAEFARRRADRSSIPGARAGAIVGFDLAPLAISGSDIRSRLARGASVRYLLPDPVLDYIGLNHLYRPPLDGH